MAKGFTEREKEAIRLKLMDAAEECWGRYGLKKTSVDELVAMANISKGSFYLFYPSKEYLFMDVFDRIDKRIKSEMFKALQNGSGSKKEIFTATMRQLMKEVQKTPWLLNLHEGDLELLTRKLPPERIGSHLGSDDNAAMELLKVLVINAAAEENKLISGVFRAIFLMLLHRQEIGTEVFDNVMDYLIDASVTKLFDELQFGGTKEVRADD